MTRNVESAVPSGSGKLASSERVQPSKKLKRRLSGSGVETGVQKKTKPLPAESGEDEPEAYADEENFDIRNPATEWTRSRLEYYMVKHRNTPDMQPLLLSIDTYCPVACGNPRFIATLVHPITGEKVQLDIASTVFYTVAQYRPTILQALKLAGGSLERKDINLCAVTSP